MIIIANDFESATQLFNIALCKNYPNNFIIAIFIDDGLRKPKITKNDIKSLNAKNELTVDYNNAVAVLSDLFAKSDLADFYAIPTESSGLKINIRKREEKNMNLDYKDLVLTDEEIETISADITSRYKDKFAEKFAINQRYGISYTKDMLDAATYGANAMYDMLLSKIAKAEKAKKPENEVKPSQKQKPKNNESEFDNETITVAEAAEIIEFLEDLLNG